MMSRPVKVWFQNRRTKYKRLHTDGKDVISNSSSKERRSASDGEDDDVDDDDNGEDENEGDVEQEEAEDTFKDLSCNQNQLRVEYNHEILAKHSKTDSSNQINIKAFAIQHNQSSLDNKDFNFTTDCHSQHNLLRSNNLSDNKGINDLSYNPSGKLKAKRAYPKCEWSSFKQISSNLNTENRLETHHLPANQSILHSSHNLLHSVLGHINQIKNAH
ncbi:unnamed protein product [Trichobilharzia regenti]|nr:unnamed protein product [Trichobilharzia regenti]